MTREELIAYDRWLTENKWGSSEIITPEQAADLYLAKHPLPPAEGAEHDIESMRKCLHHYINVDEVNRYDMLVFGAMRDYADDFAAQQQPTAEGAEEIDDETIAYAAEYQCGTPFSERWIGFVKGAKWHRSLHAQQIADKMVEATKDCYPKEFVEWKDKKELRYSSLHNRYYSDTDNGMREFTLDELFNYWKENEQEEHPTNKEKFDGNYLPDPD